MEFEDCQDAGSKSTYIYQELIKNIKRPYIMTNPK